MTVEQLIDGNDIFRIKISGETVQLINLDVIEDDDTPVSVLRAKTTRDGLQYEQVTIPLSSLETVEESIQREFKEAVYRHELMSSKLSDAPDTAPAGPNEVLN